ncbi:phage-like protein [Acinetobacter baumannii]|nr:phage-like protein [Acinetobacter baumannii]
MKNECKSAVEAELGRKLSDKEADLLEQQFIKASRELPAEDIKAWKSMSDEERAEAIADRAIKNYTDQHIKEVTNLVNDLEIREQLVHELTSHSKLNPLEAMNRKLVMHTDQSGIQSVEHNIQAVEVRYMSALADVFSKTQKGLGYLIDADKVKLLVKEIFGKPSGDAEIAGLAKSVQDTLEQLRLHYNRYGGDIKKLANYGIPQSHSHYKVIQAGQDAWVKYTLPLTDRSKYRKEDGSRMTEAEIAEVLKAVYHTIASEGHNKASVQAHLVQSETDLPVGMNMQGLHQHHREVHFKNADAWVKYQEDFGEVNFYDLLSNHVRRMSTEIGLMQTFGSNPEKLVKQLGHDLLNQMMQDPKYVKEHRKIQKQAALINKHYDELAGQALPIDSNLAQVGGMLRSWTVATKMGSAFITAFSDQATMKLASEMHGIAYTKVFGRHIKQFKNKEDRDFAISIGLGVRELTNALVRFGDDDLASASTKIASANTKTRKIANAVIRSSGLNHVTASAKRAFGSSLMHHVSNLNSTKAWDQLGPKDKKMLEGGGIKEDDWTLLRDINRTEAPTGEKLVTNKDIFNASDDLFLDFHQFDRTGYAAQELADHAFRLKEKLANKYMNYIYTETNAAVLEVGARESTFMGLGRERGTVTNELSRFFWQFKQFPLAMIMRQWTRGMAQGTPQEKFVYFAKLFAYTTVMGGLVAQIQNLTQGKDLDDPTTLDFYMKAIVKGGSASFLADAISATTDPTERSIKDFLLPAAFKDVMSVGTMVSGAGKQFLDERDSSYGAEVINIAKNNIPFQNVWYTRLVFDRLVIAELQDLFDEGYRERKQRRQESNYGISYWWDLDNNEIRVPNTNSRSE